MKKTFKTHRHILHIFHRFFDVFGSHLTPDGSKRDKKAAFFETCCPKGSLERPGDVLGTMLGAPGRSSGKSGAAPDAPRVPPGMCREASRRLQDAPKWAPDAPRRAQDASRGPQDAPQTPQDASKAWFWLVFGAKMKASCHKNRMRKRSYVKIAWKQTNTIFSMEFNDFSQFGIWFSEAEI